MSGVAAALLLLTAISTTAPSEPADLVLVSAKIWTGDRARPEATAMAVRGGRVVAVGGDEEVRAWRGAKTVVLDAKGRRVVPGFIDCHTHM
ncbi:MAG: amidohydrolase, partial [Acidobacteria bacterium]